MLALSFDEFTTRFGDLRPAGLIDPDAVLPAPDPSITDATTVICDTLDTARMVVANLARIDLGAVTVVAAKDGSADVPKERAIVLHDASPRGCALVLNLRDDGVAAEDAGLRPSYVDGPSHQVIEGAPARLPRDLSSLLRADEIDWLLSGRRVEVATLTPEVAMDLVLAAVRRLAPPPGDGQQPAG